MAIAVVFAVAAGLFTAVSSICQRRGAHRLPESRGLSVSLTVRLLHEPAWLLGMGSMIVGFGCQATALHFGDLALVQPILASEMLFVVAYIAVISPHQVRRTDWLAAAAMAGGLGMFLFTAGPSGGHAHATGTLWWLAAVSCLGLVVVVTVAAFTPLRRGVASSPGRRAALLGVATGVCWGFLAAVIKELGAHLDNGVPGLISTWSFYVLLAVGAASIVLSSHALNAGPLAASQPGFTLVDPLVASLLGIFVFRDRIQVGPADVSVEILALVVLTFGVVLLSHSHAIRGELTAEDPAAPTPTAVS